MEFTDLLAYAIKHHASDILVSTSNSPYFRIYSELTMLKIPPLDKTEVEILLQSLLSEEEYKVFLNRLEYDFAITYEKYRLRLNAFNTINGPAFAVRIIPELIKPLNEIGAPPSIISFCSLKKGLVLVTGPSASGKSTTLNAMIHYINQNLKKHIITIEDPIEYIHTSSLSLINQREVGVHTPSFESAINASLRENPDIILIGELRDYNTMKTALTAAETGHLVLATLHTVSAPQTISRFIDVFPTEEKNIVRSILSNSLQAVIAQRMFKRIDGTGTQVAFEIMHANNAIRNLIKEDKISQIYSQMQIGSNIGMITMKDSILELVAKGVIHKEFAQDSFQQLEEFQEHSSRLKKESF